MAASLDSVFSCAKSFCNPYPAQFGMLNNVLWGGEITCGHNPWLLARLVDELTVEADADGKERATWKERPKPDLSWIHNEALRRMVHSSSFWRCAQPRLRKPCRAILKERVCSAGAGHPVAVNGFTVFDEMPQFQIPCCQGH